MGLFLSASQRPCPKGCHAVVLILLLLCPLLAACGQSSGDAGLAPATAPGSTPRAVATPAIAATATRSTVASSTTTSPPFGTPTRVPSSTPTAAPFGTIPGLAEALSDVTAIHLEDDWSGLAGASPLEAHFDVARQGAGYVGTGRLAVLGSYYRRPLPPPATRAVAIPADIARAFLALLATTSGQAGAYAPRVSYTDDYPSVRLVLTTAHGEVTIYTQSQGATHVPWGLRIDGGRGEYIVDNDTPQRAITLLMPYLDYETLDLLIDEVSYGGSIATPATLGLCGAHSSPTPRVPAALAIAPRDPVAEYGLDRAYSLIITGWGVAPLPRERKLVRDPAELAALLAILHTPLPQAERPVVYSSDGHNDVQLIWRTSDAREITLWYDPELALISFFQDQREAHSAVPPAFAAALRARLCST